MIEINIIEQKDNALLERKEVAVKVSFDQATPSREELKKALATKLKAKEDVISIKNINQIYGSPNATLAVYVYKNPEKLAEVETINKKKAKEGEKPAEGEAPKEEAKPEAKTEEAPKEETPAEEKKEEPVEEKPEAPKEEAKE